MIRQLRELDRLYFGHTAGRGSAWATVFSLMMGVMPWGFVRRYLDGELVNEAQGPEDA